MDTINVINVKLCMMVLQIELYFFIPILVTLTTYQGHSSVKQFKLEILCSYQIRLKLHVIVKYVKQIMCILPFLTSAEIQGR